MLAYYQNDMDKFLMTSASEIIGQMTKRHFQQLEHAQVLAWQTQIEYLQNNLSIGLKGQLFFEFVIPRMGKRADCILLINGAVFVIEFKAGAVSFDSFANDQVHDYALDLKNFHLGSHLAAIVPILVATNAETPVNQAMTVAEDGVLDPLKIGASGFKDVLEKVFSFLIGTKSQPVVNSSTWSTSGYMPTPTIIEAAQALYQSHDVKEISRSDAGAKNLTMTMEKISELIEYSKTNKRKAICFITGVPGAGKTLAGLNIATSRTKQFENEHAVFLSGNGPLVKVLREALVRDQISREPLKKKDAERKVNSFIQNIHHFRDEYFKDAKAPIEKVVIFDEAQRAWSKHQATKFMTQKWGSGYLPQSEPEFLVSVMDRHDDWCCVICLIGGGQEINTGEAGIIEWLNALENRYNAWDVYTSDILSDPHYTIDENARKKLATSKYLSFKSLHLETSMRSFRAEKLSTMVSNIIDGNSSQSSLISQELKSKYPFHITRNLDAAKEWLREKARGSERTGLVAAASGLRLKPEGIFVKSRIDPPDWFLNDKNDVRSSFYLEEVGTQFDIQGLELDWVGVCWDADLRVENGIWKPYEFWGPKWRNIPNQERKSYLLNSYRVLMTRARQGMIIFVPKGDDRDPTRQACFYDPTYEFLLKCGALPL